MNTILFDLDGTLLPMDQNVFVETYFKKLASKAPMMGIEPDTLLQAVWAGTKAMMMNNGKQTNEQVFWNSFVSLLGEPAKNSEPIFEAFYKNEFNEVKAATQPRKDAAELVKLLRKKGYHLILATNPIFPRIATMARIAWAGLEADDFSWITTYENSSFAKPNIAYYEEILAKNNVSIEECMMVGNDVSDDMVVTAINMKTYLMTDCLIAKDGVDSSSYQNGTFEDFLAFAKSLPDLNIVHG